jgi:hypothetical protein
LLSEGSHQPGENVQEQVQEPTQEFFDTIPIGTGPEPEDRQPALPERSSVGREPMRQI